MSSINTLLVVPDIITAEEEIQILSHIELPKLSKRVVKATKTRSFVQRYGKKVYNGNIVSHSLPDWLNFLGQRLVDNRYLSVFPNHATINYYAVGDGIAPHVDNNKSGNTITIVSLLSDVNMVFSKVNGTIGDKFDIVFPKRGMIQMADDIRWKWNHSIPLISEERYSIVFRHLEDE